MNLKRTVATLGVAALVACPAAATAKNPHGGGSGKAPQAEADNGKGKGKGKGKKPKVQTYVFRGLVTGVADGTVQVAVSGGNSRGRRLAGQTLTFDLSAAKVRVADVNRDGKRDLADVAAGDRVNVQAKLAGPVDAAQPLAARHFVDKGPVPAPSEDDDDAPKAPETPEATPPAAG